MMGKAGNFYNEFIAIGRFVLLLFTTIMQSLPSDLKEVQAIFIINNKHTK